MKTRESLFCSFEEDVARGLLRQEEGYVSTNVFAIRFFDIKTGNVVGYFNNSGYWSTYSYDHHGRLIDRQDSRMRHMHVFYRADGTMRAIADEQGTWEVVVDYHPVITYNRSLGKYRRNLRTDFARDADVLDYIRKYIPTPAKEVAEEKFLEHQRSVKPQEVERFWLSTIFEEIGKRAYQFLFQDVLPQRQTK